MTQVKSDPSATMRAICRNPWDHYVPPIQILPNLWYVSGNDWVSSFLINTGEGLVLIDTGMHETAYLLLDNIRKLGFSPEDLQVILISHAHIDHIGGARAIQQVTGAKIFLGKPDLRFLRDRHDLIPLEKEFTCGIFEPDAFYSNSFQMGDLFLETLATPGHTPGCTSFFFTWKDGEKSYRLAMHGGLGLNTLNKEYFERTGEDPKLLDQFVASLHELRDRPVDICIPSHNNQRDILSIAKRVADGEEFSENPYYDPDAWKKMIDHRLQQVDEMLAREAERA